MRGEKRLRGKRTGLSDAARSCDAARWAPAAAVQLRLPGRGGPGSELTDGRTRTKSPGGYEPGGISPLHARLGLAGPRGLLSRRGTARHAPCVRRAREMRREGAPRAGTLLR